MTVRVYDPRGTKAVAAGSLAERPSALRGAVVGYLDNGKEQAAVMLERVAEVFAERHGTQKRWSKKPSHSRVAPPEALEALAQADIAVTSLGG